MNYIKSFTEEELCSFILEAKKSLFICLPLLHPRVLDSIAELQYNLNNKISINIGLDFSPETFRQGYGEIESYEDIFMVEYNVRNLKNNRISFIIADNVGYYLFFESRYFIPAEKVTLNAVMIEPVSIVSLKHHFFNSFNQTELSDQLSNAIIEDSLRLKNLEKEMQMTEKINSTTIDSETLKSVEEDLKANPPLKPDYKRIVNFYTNKFQYSQLKFKGANLKTKKIELPLKALPIRNAELKKRLETKLDLFDEKSRLDCFEPLEKFKEKIEEVRDKYLTSLKSREESILRKSDKEAYTDEVKLLEKELQKLQRESLSAISDQIEVTKQKLEKDLVDFFFENPEIIFPKGNLFHGMEADSKYIRKEAENLAKETIHRHIRWPKALDLLDGFHLKTHFSDITFEDLQNEEFRNEMHERELISEIDINKLADFGKAVTV